MYKKKIIDSFDKDGYSLSIPNIDYKDVSISFVTIKDIRRTYCKIKNSPIYYFIIEGNGTFYVDDEITVNKGDLIEISSNKKYTYKGNMIMLEIIPKSIKKLEIDEEIVQ